MNDNDSLLIEANPTSPATNQAKVFINPSSNSNKKKIFGSFVLVLFLLLGLITALRFLPERKITKKEAAFPSCVKNPRQADYGQTSDTVKITPKEQSEENGKWKLTWILTGAKSNEHFTAEIKIHKCRGPFSDPNYDQCNTGDPNSEEITKTISFDAPANVTTTTEIPFSVEESVTCCEKTQADLVSFNGNPWGSSFFIRNVVWPAETCGTIPTPTPTNTITPTITPSTTLTPTLTGTVTPTLTQTPTPTSPTNTPTSVGTTNTPTPTTEQLPKVGSILPTTGIIAGGAFLILLSFILAL